jgi:hypothetical protein
MHGVADSTLRPRQPHGRWPIRRRAGERGVVHLTFIAILLLVLVVVVFNRRPIQTHLVRGTQSVLGYGQRLGAGLVSGTMLLGHNLLRGRFSLHDPSDILATPSLWDDIVNDLNGLWADETSTLPPLRLAPIMPLDPIDTAARRAAPDSAAACGDNPSAAIACAQALSRP